jgi:hypothetical protein
MGRDSLNNPLVRFDPPLRYVPNNPPWLLEPRATLMGFPSPSAHKATESTSHASQQGTENHPKKAPSCVLADPTRPTTVPLTGFLNLSATFLLCLPSNRFQIGGAHGVASFRGLILSRSPDNSSLSAYPLDVPPFGCAVLVPGQDTSRHVCHHLGSREQHAFLVFRVFVRVKISQTNQT